MKITISAPGKVHLLGEHTVVYGKPALIASLDKRLSVTISASKKDLEIESECDHLVLEAIQVFKSRFKNSDFPQLKITVNSDIPSGCHLGSSAAVSVAMIGALLKFVKNLWNPSLINELAFEVEKKQHHNPSGGDNTTVTFGGLVWFRKEFEFLKSIWSLPQVSYHIPEFLFINTGKPKENTGDMVTLVKELWSNKQEEFRKILDDQEIQTKKLLLSIREKDYKTLKECIKKGEKNLEELGVVSDFVKNIIREIEDNGGAAKICGGGGVTKGTGILLCYHDDINILKSVAEKNNLENFTAKLGGEGVRIE